MVINYGRNREDQAAITCLCQARRVKRTCPGLAGNLYTAFKLQYPQRFALSV